MVSENTDSIDPDDVLSVKNKLKGFGYYQIPEWGITKFTDSLMFDGIRKFQQDNKLKVDGVMKPEGETETAFNKLLKQGEYASSAAQQGLSFGWEDEAEGVMGGIGYGIGSLNKNWNKRNESVTDAYKRGYKKYRDERRGVVKEGYQKQPGLTGASEAIGAIASPIKFSKISKAAPLDVIKRKSLLDSVAGGSVYGAGVTENGAADYVKNIGYGAIANGAGYGVGKKLFGGGLNRPLARATTSTLLSSSIESSYNKYKKDK